MFLTDIWPMLGAGKNSPRVDGRNPHPTKKGPGRKAGPGQKKGKRRKHAAYRRAVNKVQAAQQTNSVANAPLKAAARGG
jgi:hypothetical protein